MTDDPIAQDREGAALGRDLSDAVVLFHEAIAHRLGLTAADNKALGIVAREGPLTAGALAQLTGLTPGAVTGLVDRLVRAGYVRREPDPADRRRILVAVVPGQPRRQDEAFAALGEAMGQFLARYDRSQLTTIADFCANTIAVLRAQTRRLTEQDAAGAEGGMGPGGAGDASSAGDASGAGGARGPARERGDATTTPG